MKTLIFLGAVLLSLAACTTDEQACDNDRQIITQNKEVVTRFFEEFSRGEIDTAFAIVNDDARWWVPGDLPFSGIKSKAEYLQVVGAIQHGFPDGLKLNLTSLIGEGSKVAAEVSSQGMHVNGKTYTNQYHFLIVIEDSKIIHVKEYMDTLHLYQLITR